VPRDDPDDDASVLAVVGMDAAAGGRPRADARPELASAAATDLDVVVERVAVVAVVDDAAQR
jgi:hypothetical protein